MSSYRYYFPPDDESQSEDENITSSCNHLESSAVTSPTVATSRNMGTIVHTQQERNITALAQSPQYQQPARNGGQDVHGDPYATHPTWQSDQNFSQTMSVTNWGQVQSPATATSTTGKRKRASRQSSAKATPRKRAITSYSQPPRQQKPLEYVWIEVNPEKDQSGSVTNLKRGRAVKARDHHQQHSSSSHSGENSSRSRQTARPASGIMSKPALAQLELAPAMQPSNGRPVTFDANTPQKYPQHQEPSFHIASDGYFYPPPPSLDERDNVYGNPYPIPYNNPFTSHYMNDGSASFGASNMLYGQAGAPAVESMSALINNPWSEMDIGKIDPQLLALDDLSGYRGGNAREMGLSAALLTTHKIEPEPQLPTNMPTFFLASAPTGARSTLRDDPGNVEVLFNTHPHHPALSSASNVPQDTKGRASQEDIYNSNGVPSAELS